MNRKKTKVLIGSVERVHFPELALKNIHAKIDTGAEISVLHCDDIYEIMERHSRVLCFKLVDLKRFGHSSEIHFPEFERVKIRNSGGHIEKRYKIKTLIKFGNRNVRASFTLSDRSSMTYPVLIGSGILRKRFIVDVAKKFLLR